MLAAPPAQVVVLARAIAGVSLGTTRTALTARLVVVARLPPRQALDDVQAAPLLKELSDRPGDSRQDQDEAEDRHPPRLPHLFTE